MKPKKIGSFVLALCLAAGIGLCGAVPAQAETLGDIIIATSLREKMPSLLKLMPYSYLREQESLRPEMEADLREGKDLDEVLAALTDTVAAALSNDMPNFLLNTSVEDLDQLVAQCDALVEESFTEELMETFRAFSQAYCQAAEQYWRGML
jgi:hypothetical protein